MCFGIEVRYSCGHEKHKKFECGRRCHREYDHIVLRVPCPRCHQQEAVDVEENYTKLIKARESDKQTIRRLRTRIKEMGEEGLRMRAFAQQIVKSTDAIKRNNTADLRQGLPGERHQIAARIDTGRSEHRTQTIGPVVSALGAGVHDHGGEGCHKDNAVSKPPTVDDQNEILVKLRPIQELDVAKRLEEIKTQLTAVFVRGQVLMDERKRIERLVHGCGEHDPDGAVADKFLASPDECPGYSSIARSWPSDDDAEDGEGLAGNQTAQAVNRSVGESHGTT